MGRRLVLLERSNSANSKLTQMSEKETTVSQELGWGGLEVAEAGPDHDCLIETEMKALPITK